MASSPWTEQDQQQLMALFESCKQQGARDGGQLLTQLRDARGLALLTEEITLHFREMVRGPHDYSAQYDYRWCGIFQQAIAGSHPTLRGKQARRWDIERMFFVLEHGNRYQRGLFEAPTVRLLKRSSSPEDIARLRDLLRRYWDAFGQGVAAPKGSLIAPLRGILKGLSRAPHPEMVPLLGEIFQPLFHDPRPKTMELAVPLLEALGGLHTQPAQEILRVAYRKLPELASEAVPELWRRRAVDLTLTRQCVRSLPLDEAAEALAIWARLPETPGYYSQTSHQLHTWQKLLTCFLKRFQDENPTPALRAQAKERFAQALPPIFQLVQTALELHYTARNAALHTLCVLGVESLQVSNPRRSTDAPLNQLKQQQACSARGEALHQETLSTMLKAGDPPLSLGAHRILCKTLTALRTPLRKNPTAAQKTALLLLTESLEQPLQSSLHSKIPNTRLTRAFRQLLCRLHDHKISPEDWSRQLPTPTRDLFWLFAWHHDKSSACLSWLKRLRHHSWSALSSWRNRIHQDGLTAALLKDWKQALQHRELSERWGAWTCWIFLEQEPALQDNTHLQELTTAMLSSLLTPPSPLHPKEETPFSLFQRDLGAWLLACKDRRLQDAFLRECSEEQLQQLPKHSQRRLRGLRKRLDPGWLTDQQRPLEDALFS